MAHPSLVITAAYHVLGMADTDQLINSAHDALNDGVYSYSLGELATSSEPRWPACTRLFVAAMEELEVAVPDTATAVTTVLEFHIVRLVEGVATLSETLHTLYSIDLALRYDSSVSPVTLEPLRPFIEQYYAMEELVGYRNYREEQALPQPEDDGMQNLQANVISMAGEWCRCKWEPVLDSSWFTSNVVDLVHAIVTDRAFDVLPILADALQDAGCENEYILDHLRCSGPHRRCCFVTDLLRGTWEPQARSGGSA